LVLPPVLATPSVGDGLGATNTVVTLSPSSVEVVEGGGGATADGVGVASSVDEG
jgi:hypothetical protein